MAEKIDHEKGCDSIQQAYSVKRKKLKNGKRFNLTNCKERESNLSGSNNAMVVKYQTVYNEQRSSHTHRFFNVELAFSYFFAK